VTVDELLAAARARIDRVPPEDLAREMAAGALVVDTRTSEQRARDGDLPGALCVDRTVFEWRLDPTSPYRIPEATHDRRIIVVCSEGYSSSLAAATLVDLGFERAADLEGGFTAWARRRDEFSDR
jgi:rhodanese-related sulfurtransferase